MLANLSSVMRLTSLQPCQRSEKELKYNQNMQEAQHKASKANVDCRDS